MSTSPAGPRRHERSFLTAEHGQPRARRAADATTVVVGLVLVVWALLVYGSSDPLEEALTQFAAALPEWAVALLAFGYTSGLLYAAAVVVAFLVRRRWAALRDVALSAALAVAAMLTLTAVYDELWPPFLTELLSGTVRQQFPVIRVGAVTAVLVAASPNLARPIRRVGWAIVLLISAAAVALALAVPSGVVAAVGVALVCAGGVLLAFGSPSGYPDVAAVADALDRLGLDVSDLAIAPDQSWGVRRLMCTGAADEPVEVKAYGRDTTDSQVAAKLWRSAMYRGGGRSITLSRLQSVEHEALLTLLAERAGVRVPRILAAAAATDEVAVLVATREGTDLADLAEGDLPDHAALEALWSQVAAMHASGLTHGGLDSRAVRLTANGFVIAEFAQGSVVHRDADAALDIAHLLFATAAAVGAGNAVAAAVAGLGPKRLAACLGYLQPPALAARERRSVPNPGALLTDLRDRVAAATGAEVPEPVRLRRLDAKRIVTIVLAALFLSALVPLLAGIDYAEIWASLADANWWLAGAAIAAGQLMFLPQATAMLSAVGRPIPLRPMTILQPAVAFISFAVPGMAGRVAMESSFLYKYGIPPAVSVTKGAVDAFSGFLVQVAILVAAFLTGAITLAPDPVSGGSPRSVSWGIIAVVLALAAAVVVVVWRVPKVRDRVVPQIKEAWGALAEVMRSPRLALGLLGSQLAVQILSGLALWAALLSLGERLSLVSCTAVVVATALLQGILPVPGGIGVSEAVLTAFLVPLGVPPAEAMGAAVIWRLASFYVPAVEGLFASKYLQRRGYL
jgi:uncharacterized protein (TIRG00374 family)